MSIIFKKNRRMILAAGLLFLLGVSAASAQTYVTAPMSTAPAAGSYYSNTSISLAPGFSFTASAGQSLQLYVLPADCLPLNTVPTASQNYIMTSTPRIPGYNPSGAGYTSCDVMQAIQYFDGLGRPLQTVNVHGSGDGTKDIVQPFAYDQYGREATRYLPYAAATSNGSYKTDALTAGAGLFQYYNPTGTGGSQQSNGIAVIPTPYAQKAFEPSPLNRVIEQGAPGDPWQLTGTTTPSGATPGHTVKLIYTTNDNVSYWAKEYQVSIDASGNRTLTYNNSYNTGQLLVQVTRDENWTSANPTLNTTEEYKDQLGHIILKRTYNQVGTTTQTLSTYYVYDDAGELAFVLPPASNADNAALTSANNQTTLNNLCYQYQYDERGRPTQKRLPGKDWQYIVYNQFDQPVLTQDANQRSGNQWTVTKYDGQGRVIMTGLWNAGSSIPLSALQASIYGSAQWDVRDYNNNTTGYDISSYPALSVILTINYYDDYNNIPGAPAIYTAPAGTTNLTRGLATAAVTSVLNTITNPSPDMLWEVSYYDDLGRNIEAYDQHYLGGSVNSANYDAVTTSYDFSNQPIGITRKHWNTTSTAYPALTIANSYYYDHMGRKVQTWEQLTNGSNLAGTNTLISKIDYNDIGQVLNKHLHSTDGQNFLQNVAYTYNERGWLLSSQAALFQLQLQYNVVNGITGISPVAMYNGNIASQSWGTQAAPNTNSYVYTYDNLNRLITGVSLDNYNESLSYDLMGNVQTLQRTWNSTTPIDNLSYTYNNTNQVQSITDAAADNSTKGYRPGTYSNYQYDGNGNMTVMPTPADGTPVADIHLQYNLLNLPQSLTGGRTITYTYDAAGRKLRKVYTTGSTTTTTDYINGIEYDNGILAFAQTEEGRVLYNGGNFNYEYYLGDNLGNTRVTFDAHTTTATLVQQDDYFPFGYEISRGTVNSPKNEYLYNKKELQEETQQYDYGARYYDPVIARWTSIDPLAEKGRRWSPYTYAFDDPIRFMDPDGMWPDWFDKGVKNAKAAYNETVKQVKSAYNKTVADTKKFLAAHTVSISAKGSVGAQIGLDAPGVKADIAPFAVTLVSAKEQISHGKYSATSKIGPYEKNTKDNKWKNTGSVEMENKASGSIGAWGAEAGYRSNLHFGQEITNTDGEGYTKVTNVGETTTHEYKSEFSDQHSQSKTTEITFSAKLIVGIEITISVGK